MKNSTWVTILIIVGIIIVSFVILNRSSEEVPEELAKCIGENAILYTQLGCHACENQEKLFGDSYQYLNVVDCFYERDKCDEITATPTWIIDGQSYIGVQSIETLKELTEC